MEPHLVGASCTERGPPAWGGGMATGKGAGGSEAWRGPGWPGWLVESYETGRGKAAEVRGQGVGKCPARKDMEHQAGPVDSVLQKEESAEKSEAEKCHDGAAFQQD